MRRRLTRVFPLATTILLATDLPWRHLQARTRRHVEDALGIPRQRSNNQYAQSLDDVRKS
jgi:hypothetical protein